MIFHDKTKYKRCISVQVSLMIAKEHIAIEDADRNMKDGMCVERLFFASPLQVQCHPAHG